MTHVINNVLIGLNNLGRVFCDYAAGVFVQSALLVILLLVVDLLLRKRVRAVFRYCVWLLVLVKLILPPTLSLPTGIGYWFGDHLPAASSISNRAFDVTGLERASPSGEMPQFRPARDLPDNDSSIMLADSALTPLTWQAVLFILWLVGVFAFLVVLVQRVRFVRGLIAVSSPAKKELLGLLEQCRRKIGVRWDIRLRVSDTIPSPAVCGFFRPTVLIPAPLIEKLSPEGLRATLIHELAHIKRGDLWVNSVQTFLQVIYFYNPFVWFANAVIRRVCEEAVDETVLVTLGGQAKNYSNTLIDIGEMVFWRADLSLRLIGVAESKKALQWRIKHMLTRPIPKSSKLGALGIIVIVTIAAALLPMARAQKPGKDNKPAATVNERKPTKSLHQAVADGDIEQVKLLIAKGADVNAKDEKGHTPLHFAARHGYREVAKLLITHGADVNASMADHSWTPLLDAACAGHAQVVKVLLENGAKVDVGDNYGYTPLVYALWSKDEEGIKSLISAGANINKRPSKNDCPPLFYAVWEGYKRGIRILIDAGANVNAEADNGWTPLHYAINGTDLDVISLFVGTGVKIPDFHDAALEGNLAKVTQLVESGTDVDTKDRLGWTPSYWALSAGQKKVFAYLLSQGANVRVKTNQGRTLLHQASQAGFVEIVKSLIAKGVEVDAKPDSGNTPLKIAAGAGHKEIVKLLIANGAVVNVTAKNGTHPLGNAAVNGHEEVVRLLIASGAKVNLQPEDKLMCGTALHAAARGGHIAIFDLLIANGADVNALYKNGTPLHLAVAPKPYVEDKTSAEIVEKLLAHGADVNAKSPLQGRTPLHEAVDKRRYKTAECLIAAGANVNATDNEGKTPLSLAQELGRTEIAELLRKHGAKAEKPNEDNKPVATENEGKPAKSLHQAARDGDIEQVKKLIAQGADVNASEGDKPWTPLFDAVWNGQTQVVKLLLQHGAKVDAGEALGYTPLFYAIWSKHEEGLKALISAGADINKRPNENDCPPLFYAVWEDYKRGIRILIDAGANVNAEDEKGWTPFRYAALGGSRDMVELFAAKGADVSSFHLAAFIGDLARVKRFIDQGTDVDTKDKFGWTPLYWAASTGQRDVAEFLVAKGADVNVKTDSDLTALHQAGRSGARELAELLISNGADVNATTKNADTPLHLAAEKGHRDVVEFLIVKGADINAKDKTGGTPLHNATKVGHKEVGEILIAGGSDVNAKDGQGRTPLHWAARTTPPGYLSVLKGRRDTAEILIANGADLNAKNKLGRTPLHTAARNGRKEVGEILIAKGADINAKDNEGRTPLWWAKEKGRTEIAELLRKHGAKE